MRYNLLILITYFLFSSLQSFSQDAISYTYDNSGNRIEKRVVIGGLKSELIKEPIEQKQEFEETLNETAIKLFPNPTEGKLTLEFENLTEQPSIIIGVYDINGRLIINRKIFDRTTELDLTNNSSGTYFLKIRIDDSESQWKIIKR